MNIVNPETSNKITCTWCSRKVMRLIFFEQWIVFFLQIKVIPFKLVPLGSYTVPEELFPLFVAVVEGFCLNTLQLACYALLDISRSTKFAPFLSGFWAGWMKISRRDWDPAKRVAEEQQECFFLPKIHYWILPCYMGRCRCAASKCVQCLVAHVPPFSWIFQGLPDGKFDWQFVLVAQIPCGRSPDCQKKTNEHRSTLFCVGVVLQNSWFITCDNVTEESWLPLKAVQNIKTHIPPIGLLLSWGSLERSWRTLLLPKSCVKIWWTVNQLKFKSLLIILNVNRRSDLTRDHSTLSSVFEVESLPARGSSSTCSQPSKKELCHLNACALDRECSP